MYRIKHLFSHALLCFFAFAMLWGQPIYSTAGELSEEEPEVAAQNPYYLHENSNVDTIHAVTEGALPCIGEAKILVFYVEFKNGEENWPIDAAEVNNLFFSEAGKNNGGIAYTGEDSLRSYYYRSSYGRVDIMGTVYEYETQYDTSYYTDLGMALDEVIEHYRDTINWDSYDGNNDGYIDGIYLIARNKHSFGGPNFVGTYVNTVGSKKICKACFLDSYDFGTMCHETCHMFGPADMYEGVGVNPSGIKTACFMENGYGDLPSPTKFVLGWLDNVKFVDDRSVGTYALRSYSRAGDVLVIYPNGDSSNRNWFFVEYVTPEGNNPEAGNGLRVWKTQMNLDGDYNINGAKEFCGGMPNSPYEYLEAVHPEGGYNYYMSAGETISPYTYPSTSYSDTFHMIGTAKFLKDLTFSGIEIKHSGVERGEAKVTVQISDTPDLGKAVRTETSICTPDKVSSFLHTSEKYHIATINADAEIKASGTAKLVSLDGTKTIPLTTELTQNNKSILLYIDKQYLRAVNMASYEIVLPTISTYYGKTLQSAQITDVIDLQTLPVPYEMSEETYSTDFNMSWEYDMVCFKESNEKIVSIFLDNVSNKLYWGEYDLTQNRTAKYELGTPAQLEISGNNESISIWADGGCYYVYINGYILCYQNKALVCYLDTATLSDSFWFCGVNENSYFAGGNNNELYHLVKQGNSLSLEKVAFINEFDGGALKNLVLRHFVGDRYGSLEEVHRLGERQYIINATDALYLIKDGSLEQYDFADQLTEHQLNRRTVEILEDRIYVFDCGNQLIRYEFDFHFNLIEKKVLLYKLSETIWGPFTMNVEFVEDVWVVSMESVSNTNAISYSSTFVMTFDRNGTIINYYRYGDASYRYICQIVPLTRDLMVGAKVFSFFYLDRPNEHFYSVWEPYSKEQHKRVCECGDVQYAQHIWNANGGKRCSVCGMVEQLVTGISLNKVEVNLQPGATFALTATVSPNNASIKTIVWKSSNEAVATVSTDGKVTAIGVGSATVTATATDGSGKSATCTVTVTQPVPETPEDLLKAFVERMYTVALGRAAEAEGLDFYVQRLLSGDSNGACLAESFLCSPEFLNKGHSDAEYVKVLYRTFFDREPAASEVNYWVEKLTAGESKAFVLSGFVNSYEFDNLCTSYGISRGFMREDGKPLNPGIGRFAERMYTVVLERAGEKEGIEYWSLSIANGVCTPKDAAKNFFLSPEYVNKNTSDAQYITTLYKAFMDREPEAGGVEYWQNLLQNGATREQILEGFADSAEFKGIMASFGL